MVNLVTFSSKVDSLEPFFFLFSFQRQIEFFKYFFLCKYIELTLSSRVLWFLKFTNKHNTKIAKSEGKQCSIKVRDALYNEILQIQTIIYKNALLSQIKNILTELRIVC